MRALDGVRVLDMSRFIAGPFCCQILGDNGADVVKVEKPDGEPARQIAPIVHGESLYFMAYNGSKRGITANMRTPAGLDLLRQLIAKADILVENFRAGTMEQMGLGYDALSAVHPGLIMISISGFGVEGPYVGRPAFDEIIQSMSGLASLTGEADGPPMLSGTYVADFVTGLYAAVGGLLALQLRKQGGQGQWVRTNLLQSLISTMNTSVSRYLVTGEVATRRGNRNAVIAPGNMYRARDGYVTIEVLTQGMWKDLVTAMDRPDLLMDPRYADVASRHRNMEPLDREIQAWMQARTMDQIVSTLEQHSVPCGPVQDIPALVKDPQFQTNQTVVPLECPGVGTIPLLAPPIRLTGDANPRRTRPPRLGEHTEEVLADWLGLEPEAIQRLRAARAL